MRQGSHLRRGPHREYAVIVAVAIAIGTVTLLAALRSPAHRAPPPGPTSTAIGAASPVIGGQPLPTSTGARVSAAQLAAAQRAGRRFLTSYLPVLYGRRPVSSLADADPHVRAELAAAGHAPRAPRNRTPRIAQLTAHAQSDGTVVVVSVVADGVQRPYQIVCQLTHNSGGWQVSELANY